MTADDLAQLHARAMKIPAPWTSRDFQDLLAMPGTFLIPLSSDHEYPGGVGAKPPPSATPKVAQNLIGFALGRVTLDEAELLTLAVDTSRHRQGIGRTCLQNFERHAATQGATTGFLDVAATNTAAIALYEQSGWHQTGRRPGYYRSEQGRIDAILMQKTLQVD